MSEQPAFPCFNNADWEYNWLHKGMTLRDWFAGQALVGLIGGDGELNVYAGDKGEVKVAQDAYLIADAMMKARGGQP
jgi:hypothetical protein